MIQIGYNSGTPLTLKSPSVDIGQKIFAIGSPLGLEGTISDGIISGLRNFERFSLLQISAPISPGNSGGPIVNENGEVIGVAPYTFSEGQNLNFAVPVKYLKELFNNQTSLVSLSSIVKADSTPSKKTSADFKGVSISKMLVTTQCCSTDVMYSIKFSLKNNLRQGVANIRTSIIIYDIDGEMLDYGKKTFYASGDGSYCLPAKHSTREHINLPYSAVNYLQKTGAFRNLKNLLKFSEFRIIDYETGNCN